MRRYPSLESLANGQLRCGAKRPKLDRNWNMSMKPISYANFKRQAGTWLVYRLGLHLHAQQFKWNVGLLKASPNDHLVYKHAPLRTKGKGAKNTAPACCMKCTKKTSSKKNTAFTNNPVIWHQFKDTRNNTNNLIKQEIHKYFTDKSVDACKLDPSKTWRIIGHFRVA